MIRSRPRFVGWYLMLHGMLEKKLCPLFSREVILFAFFEIGMLGMIEQQSRQTSGV